MHDYKTELLKIKHKIIPVIVKQDRINKVKDFCNELIKVKERESHHVIDGNKEFKRFYTGFLGESAVESFLGVDFMDWTIGESSIYHVADLSKLSIDCGVKTVEKGKFPVIHKQSDKSQIICIKVSLNKVYILGIADIDVLNTYQDDNLILSPFLRRRNVKTGFYGFEKLNKMKTVKQFKDDSI